ncbi:MAG: histidine kinase N-terminal 7TM domain-containing protein [Halapricum sp.]
MPWQWSPYVFILLTAAAIAATCALYGLASIRREGARGHVVAFVALCLPIVVWCALYAVQIAMPTLAGKLLVRKVLMFGMLGLGPTWLGFAMMYTGRERYLRVAAAVNAVFVGGFVTMWVVTLVTTIPAPMLRGAHLVTRGSVTLLVTELGPISFVFLAYLYGCFLVGAWWLVDYALHAPAAISRRSALTVLALAIPTSASVLRVLGVTPSGGVKLGPVSMVISVVLLGIAVFRYRLFDVRPMAWDTVLAQIRDGVLVLDDHERVVEANAAARSLTPGPAALVGAPASERLPDYDRLRAAGTVVAEHDERAVEYERSPLRVDSETRGWVVDAHGWTIEAVEVAEDGARFEIHGVEFADREPTGECDVR